MTAISYVLLGNKSVWDLNAQVAYKAVAEVFYADQLLGLAVNKQIFCAQVRGFLNSIK